MAGSWTLRKYCSSTLVNSLFPGLNVVFDLADSGPREQRAATLPGIWAGAARPLGQRRWEEHARQGNRVWEPWFQLWAAPLPHGHPWCCQVGWKKGRQSYETVPLTSSLQGDEGGVWSLQQAVPLTSHSTHTPRGCGGSHNQGTTLHQFHPNVHIFYFV